MAHESSYVPGNVVEKWIDDRLPIIRWSKEHLMDFPTPKNLNYWWTFGGILAFMLGVQIVTGIVLAMHYTPHVSPAFDSVEHIRRDVNGGRILQAVHAVFGFQEPIPEQFHRGTDDVAHGLRIINRKYVHSLPYFT